MQTSFEHIHLGEFPTPLHELRNFTSYLGGPRIFIKRDDLTGLALGGNKIRKLEYILAEAQAQKAEVIITIGATSSNHARQTAAAAAVLGMKCQLVLIGREPEQMQGNYLLNHLLGATCHCVKNKEVEATVSRLVEENNYLQKKSYVIPAGGHTKLGAIAYMKAYQEIHEQSGIDFAAVFTAIGTGTTYAGLHLGHKISQDDTRIMGISVGGDQPWCHNEILGVVNEVEDQLNIPPSSSKDLNVYDNYIGEGYTQPYPRLKEVIELLARTEGILLDPVYSGKAMVGLIDLVEKGEFSRDQNVLFLHTGGAPELFAMNKLFCPD